MSDSEIESQDNGKALMVTTGGALESIARAEMSIAIDSAHMHKRQVAVFKQNAISDVTLDERVAESCFYAVPREGKTVEGPSIRLAEIVASRWGNLRFGGRVIQETDRFIVAQGQAHDLENNIQVSIEVPRRITNKHGKRFSEDMIATTARAAIAIAIREAIFKVVPRAFVDAIMDRAKATAAGDEKTLSARRQAAFSYFKSQGVSSESLCAKLGVSGIEEVTIRHLTVLSGLTNALKDGDTTLDEMFGQPEKKDTTGAELKEAMKPPVKESKPPATTREKPPKQDKPKPEPKPEPKPKPEPEPKAAAPEPAPEPEPYNGPEPDDLRQPGEDDDGQDDGGQDESEPPPPDDDDNVKDSDFDDEPPANKLDKELLAIKQGLANAKTLEDGNPHLASVKAMPEGSQKEQAKQAYKAWKKGLSGNGK